MKSPSWGNVNRIFTLRIRGLREEKADLGQWVAGC